MGNIITIWSEKPKLKLSSTESHTAYKSAAFCLSPQSENDCESITCKMRCFWSWISFTIAFHGRSSYRVTRFTVVKIKYVLMKTSCTQPVFQLAKLRSKNPSAYRKMWTCLYIYVLPCNFCHIQTAP